MRTRFAPSPTGSLHVGGLRTALYAFLLARQSRGQFLLRIEDTDQARSVEGAIENILRTLRWAGLTPDEGIVMTASGEITEKGDVGPYLQSKRLPLYKEYADKLLASGDAYIAFDTPDDIEAMKQQMIKDGYASPNYNAAVRMKMKNSLSLTADDVKQRLDAGEAHVVRFKMPEKEEVVEFDDAIRGRVSFSTKVLDDQVLLKSDGFPTYHLAHVVDDSLMKIDLVVRGEEWLSSLPKHLLLFRALGLTPPKYAHVPLLLNKDRTKLSKRQNDVAAEEYMAKGYLPEVLLNFLALLGWNSGTEQELFSLDELIKSFSLDRVQKGGAIFDLTKLDWLQGQWMRKKTPEDFIATIHPIVEEAFPAAKNDQQFAAKASLIQERITFPPEAKDMMSFFYETPVVPMELLANEKQKVPADLVPKLLTLLHDALSAVSDWSQENITKALDDVMTKENLKRGQILWPLRAALTGKPFSPGAYEVAAFLGKEETLKRLQAAR